MNDSWKSVHLTGIGGVGMTGIALILDDLGYIVTGSDEECSKNTDLLISRGIKVSIGHHPDNLPKECDLLVYSSAVQESNPERKKAFGNDITQIQRGLFLAQLANQFNSVVSIAGSHGKTTVSAMLSHILLQTGYNCGYLVGGKLNDHPLPAQAGDSSILITEVDESDGTQAQMHSTIGIISNIEDDHSWSVGGVDKLYQCFKTFGMQSNTLIVEDSQITKELFVDHPNCEFISFSTNIPGLELKVYGRHNRFNATLAVNAALALGVEMLAAIEAINTFTGVDRRQSIRFDAHSIKVIEDYAHHPSEVRETIAALRELNPKRLTIVFQAHRYERIARYATEFSTELSKADNLIVTAPFAAWMDDAELADPKIIADTVIAIPSRYSTDSYEILANELANHSKEGDLIAIFGAGTITDLIKPLVEELSHKWK